MSGITVGLDALLPRIVCEPGDLDQAAGLVWWSLLAEPGDRLAGALVGALDPARAAAAVRAGADARRVCRMIADRGAADPIDERELARALERWAPRVSDDRFAQVVRSSASLGIRLLPAGHAHWPTGLDDLGPNAPLGLWTLGEQAALAGPFLGVVGARASTGYGEHVTHELVSALPAGVGVLSGGAYGIDGTAHRAALAGGRPTVAILAGGLDRLYPSGHEQLFRNIQESAGAIVSEVPVGTPPSKWRFLARNSRISAAAAAVLVVEAGFRSGAINTAHHAAQIGRPLGAVPGPITSAASAGCHRLIREGIAECVTDGGQAAQLLGDLSGADDDQWERVNPERWRVIDALAQSRPRSIEEIARRSGLSEAEARSLLGRLELDGEAARRGEGWVTGPSARRRPE